MFYYKTTLKRFVDFWLQFFSVETGWEVWIKKKRVLLSACGLRIESLWQNLYSYFSLSKSIWNFIDSQKTRLFSTLNFEVDGCLRCCWLLTINDGKNIPTQL